MGLDEFLIPRDHSPTTTSRSLDDLADVILAPPIDLDASEGAEKSGTAASPKAAPIESSPSEVGREGATPRLAPESVSALADVIVAVPSEVGDRGGRPESAEPESFRTNGPKPRDVRPSLTTFETSPPPRDFLATRWDPEASSINVVDRIDEDFISTSPMTSADRDAIASAKPSSSDPRRRAEAPSSRPSPPTPRWEDVSSVPDDFGNPLGGPVDGPGLGNDLDGVEGRLSLVADRLERAVERLAAPSPPLGSRPRPFRGRIDD